MPAQGSPVAGLSQFYSKRTVSKIVSILYNGTLQTDTMTAPEAHFSQPEPRRCSAPRGTYPWYEFHNPQWAPSMVMKGTLAAKRIGLSVSERAKRAVRVAFHPLLKRMLLRERRRGFMDARIFTGRLGPGIRTSLGLLMARLSREERQRVRALRQGKPEPRLSRKTRRPAGVVLSYSCNEGQPAVVRLRVARKRLNRFQR